MPLPIYQVDAFAKIAFQGNPAAIVILGPDDSDSSEFQDDFWPLEAAQMQAIASEMNLSETAFLLGQSNRHLLRWFTPEYEVDLCGHATLASSHILYSEGIADATKPIEFQTRSGLLTTALVDGLITMDFPAEVATECQPAAGLLDALGIDSAITVGRNRFDWLVQVATEDIVRRLEPNFAALAQIETRGVIVTSESSQQEIDFVSRFFGPRAGINEDPVTGSAHCCLAPFWSSRLGNDQLVGFQASKRGGVVNTEVNGDRVTLAGSAITVLSGSLRAGLESTDSK